MNRKYIIIIIILAIVAAAVISACVMIAKNDTPTTPPVAGSTMVRSGTVVEVNKTEITFDGPYRIIIQSADTSRTTIAIPSMGLPLCAAYKAGLIQDPNTIVVGQSVQVSGTLGEDGSIVPCQSEDHYLR